MCPIFSLNHFRYTQTPSRSHQESSNGYLVAKIGVDTAENKMENEKSGAKITVNLTVMVSQTALASSVVSSGLTTRRDARSSVDAVCGGFKVDYTSSSESTTCIPSYAALIEKLAAQLDV